jgi:PDGLE domain
MTSEGSMETPRLDRTGSGRPSRTGWVVAGLGIAVLVVIAAAFLASGDPDGLERVAEDTGFLDAAEGSPFALIADYVFPGLDGPLATIVAGVIGVAVLFGLVWAVGRLLARRRA